MTCIKKMVSDCVSGDVLIHFLTHFASSVGDGLDMQCLISWTYLYGNTKPCNIM